MAFSTPATETAGQVLTASYLNTYVRDNVAWMATDSPACSCYNSVAQSVANTTDTYLTFNSERFDNAAMHSTSSNTTRITVPTGAAGKYLFGGSIEFQASASGDRLFGLRLNGTTFIIDNSLPPGSGGVTCRAALSTVYAMSVADYGEVRAFQSSGGALNVTAANNYSPNFYAFWYRT